MVKVASSAAQANHTQNSKVARAEKTALGRTQSAAAAVSIQRKEDEPTASLTSKEKAEQVARKVVSMCVVTLLRCWGLHVSCV